MSDDAPARTRPARRRPAPARDARLIGQDAGRGRVPGRLYLGPAASRLAADRTARRRQGDAGLAHRALPAGHAPAAGGRSVRRVAAARDARRRPRAPGRAPHRGRGRAGPRARDPQRRTRRPAGCATRSWSTTSARLKRFFGLSAADGGRRVVIVDAADEMNPSAANALLKMLEEPPARRDAAAGLAPAVAAAADDPLALPRRCASPRWARRSGARRWRRPGPSCPADADGAGGAGRPGRSATALRLLIAGRAGALRRAGRAAGHAAAPRPAARARSWPRPPRSAAPTPSGSTCCCSLVELLLARLARTGATGHPPAPEAAPGEARCWRASPPDPAPARRWAGPPQTLSAPRTPRPGGQP